MTAPGAPAPRRAQPHRRRPHELELGDGGLADARHLAQELLRRIERFGKCPQARKNGFGERLGIAPRGGAEQDQLEQLIVGEGIGTGIAKASP
jgi:hypothetical protein